MPSACRVLRFGVPVPTHRFSDGSTTTIARSEDAAAPSLSSSPAAFLPGFAAEAVAVGAAGEELGEESDFEAVMARDLIAALELGTVDGTADGNEVTHTTRQSCRTRSRMARVRHQSLF